MSNSDDSEPCFPALGWQRKKRKNKRAKPKKEFYRSKKWKELRSNIFKRDKYRCFVCGDKGGYINAHHVIPVAFLWGNSKKEDFLTDPANLVTVCRRCHNWIHELGPFFNPYKPKGTPMRAWRFAYAYFFMSYFFPEVYGQGKRPKVTRKSKRKSKPKRRRKNK